ncbi:hypothetical protein V7075_14705 [Neobacillus drentensis]
MNENFKALVVDKPETDFSVGVKNLSLNDLSAGEETNLGANGY